MTDAPPGNVVYGTLNATVPMPTASLTGSVRAMVQATAEVIRAPDVTVADLQAVVAELQTTVREMARLQAAAAASAAQASGLAAATFRWTVVGSLAGVVGALIALLAYAQTTIHAKRPDPTPTAAVAPQPTVTVVVPPAPTAHQGGGDPGSHPQDRRAADC